MQIPHKTLRRLVKRWDEENNDRQATLAELDAMIIAAAKEIMPNEATDEMLADLHTLTLGEYQEHALTFWLCDIDLERDREPMLYLSNAINEEAGEIAGVIKKLIRDDGFRTGMHLDDVRNIALEAGDVLFYLSMLAKALGLSLTRIAELNIEKLTERKTRDCIRRASKHR